MSLNLLQKIAKARKMFQESGVKQSGQNKFAGYSYFELSDILPKINNIGLELGFLCVVCFADDKASLTVHDCDSDAKLAFESPMSTANLKGCHDVQNLGAVETYIKRYLYQNAFEIVEHDAVNGTHNPDEKPANIHPTQPKPAPQSDVRKKAGEEIKALLADPAFTDSDKAIFRKDFAACKDTDLHDLVESVKLALSVKKIIPCDVVGK